ncbi:MAG TPA: hypothetical protein VH814_25055 [Steroidobacteraceae bacterium]|jgi:hypothetical protein
MNAQSSGFSRSAAIFVGLFMSWAGGSVAQSTAVSNNRGTSNAELRRIVLQLQATVGKQQAQIAKLQEDLTAVKNHPVFKLTRHIKVDRDANGYARVLISGANVQIVNGSTQETVNGVGNLIIGHNDRANVILGGLTCSNYVYRTESDCVAAGFIWGRDFKTGSHNLIVGNEHSYGGTGGVVFGFQNVITGPYATVTGGHAHLSTGRYSSVSGGEQNHASGDFSSVSGGSSNVARGRHSSVTSGWENLAAGIWSAVTGGAQNEALETYSTVSGGTDNTAAGGTSVVSGGLSRTASGQLDWVAGDLFSDQ